MNAYEMALYKGYHLLSGGSRASGFEIFETFGCKGILHTHAFRCTYTHTHTGVEGPGIGDIARIECTEREQLSAFALVT